VGAASTDKRLDSRASCAYLGGLMKKPRDVIHPRRVVYALRKRAERLGSVTATDEKEAVECSPNWRCHFPRSTAWNP
jgi:glycine/D-amino acid oxidase-like deaminating enzyme